MVVSEVEAPIIRVNLLRSGCAVVQNDDAAAPWLDLVQFPQLLEARRRLVLNVLDLRRQLRAVGLEARAQTRRREDPLWQACTKCLIFIVIT